MAARKKRRSIYRSVVRHLEARGYYDCNADDKLAGNFGANGVVPGIKAKTSCFETDIIV